MSDERVIVPVLPAQQKGIQTDMTDPTPHSRTQRSPLLGTWMLQSFTTEYTDTHETIKPFGEHPNGYLSYGPDGRMYAIVAGEGRRSPSGAVPSDAEKIELFSGMAAYAGSYTIEGDKVIHRVDISWNEAWTGTDQVRQFKIDGNSLQIRAMDSVDGRPATATLVWTKVRP